MSIRVDIELDSLLNIGSEARKNRARLALSERALEDMTPYVPMDTGALRSTGTASPEQIRWWGVPYARAQFYGTNGLVVFRNYTTPGTGPRWDLKATGNHMRDWEKVYLGELID